MTLKYWLSLSCSTSAFESYSHLACRYANTGMNTFFFAMTSLELKHRAPKVIARLAMSALFSMLLLVQLLSHPVFCCCNVQQCALLPDILSCVSA